MTNSCHEDAPVGYRWLYTAKIRLKNGMILYARDYGKKAFRILVPDR